MKETTSGIIIGAVLATGANAILPEEINEVIVYQENPERIIEVLSQISVSDEDFNNLIPTVAVDKAVIKTFQSKSDIEDKIIQATLDGKGVTVGGILRPEEIAHLKFKVIEHELTDEEKLNGGNLDEFIRQQK
jgi:hypothetical protein